MVHTPDFKKFSVKCPRDQPTVFKFRKGYTVEKLQELAEELAVSSSYAIHGLSLSNCFDCFVVCKLESQHQSGVPLLSSARCVWFCQNAQYHEGR